MRTVSAPASLAARVMAVFVASKWPISFGERAWLVPAADHAHLAAQKFGGFGVHVEDALGAQLVEIGRKVLLQ